MLVVVSAPPAAGAARKCFGKRATIVSDGPVITGTRNDDVIVSTSTAADTYIYAGRGNDLICGGVNFDYIHGGAGRDKMRGNGSFDFLRGDRGNDVLMGEANDGENDGAIYFGARTAVEVDLVAGTARGEGTDRLINIATVFGSEYNDRITGGPNPDFLWGEGGNDTILGGPKSDLITPGFGDDYIDAQAGEFDTIYFDTYGVVNGVVADLAAGTATGQGTDTFSNAESLYGTPFDDDLRGDDDFNALTGAAGNDSLDGRDGFDYALYWLAESSVTASLQTNSASSATEGTDAFANMEALMGGDFDDALTGDEAANLLGGLEGDDTLTGNGGDDLFFASQGTDTITGGAGTNDLWDYIGAESVNANLATGQITGQTFATSVSGVEGVDASDGSDVLVGDDFANVLFGRAGDDTMSGAGGNDAADGGDGVDEFNGGPGEDACDGNNIETPISCEIWTAPTIHPLKTRADAIVRYRRNFG